MIKITKFFSFVIVIFSFNVFFVQAEEKEDDSDALVVSFPEGLSPKSLVTAGASIVAIAALSKDNSLVAPIKPTVQPTNPSETPPTITPSTSDTGTSGTDSTGSTSGTSGTGSS